MVELLPLALSDKTGKLDFVRGFPEVTTLKSVLFFPELTLYHFIDLFKLCTGSMSVTVGFSVFFPFCFSVICSTKVEFAETCDRGHA